MTTRTRSEIARQAALARWGRKRPTTDRSDLADTVWSGLGYVEVLPGVWQPQEMTAAERWKQQMRRRTDGET